MIECPDCGRELIEITGGVVHKQSRSSRCCNEAAHCYEQEAAAYFSALDYAYDSLGTTKKIQTLPVAVVHKIKPMSCKKCGCKLHPCRCVFDNEKDFIKYGEMFLEIELPKKSFLRRLLDRLKGYAQYE